MKDEFECNGKQVSRYEDPLWSEELEETKHRLISMKRVSSKNFKSHTWKILDNKALVMTIESSSLKSDACEFLLKPDGINFVLALYKKGNTHEQIVDVLNSKF